MKKIVAGIIGIALLSVVVYKITATNRTPNARRQNAPLVKIEKPLRETVIDKLQLTGDVAAIQQASIFSKISGNLERVYVDMGSRIRRNQVLAVIDSTELHEQFQLAAATFYNARVKHQRMRQLLEQNLVSKEDIDDAEAAMKVAEANSDVAKTRLGYAHITAPFAGYITKRYLDPGALVTTGNATLFTLMDLDSVKVIVNVLEKDLSRLAQVKKATVTVDAFPGKEYSGSYVYTCANATAQRTRVTAGSEHGARLEIVTGLSGAEDVITTGQQFVKSGGQVIIQN